MTSQQRKKESVDYVSNFNDMVKLFLDTNPSQQLDRRASTELEVRFGTRGIDKITRINFNHVANKLLSIGFITNNSNGRDILKISPEYADPATGKMKLSNIRCEIVSLNAIQTYCKTNNLNNITPRLMSFVQKRGFKKQDGEFVRAFNNDDFNFRLSMQTERTMPIHNNEIKTIIDTWGNLKKNFRLMNRISFAHPEYPVIIDMSIVKTNKYKPGESNLEYTIESANIFNNVENFEIEIEVNNSKIGAGTQWTSDNASDFANMLRVVIKHVLSGLQQTNYPISYPLRKAVLQNYMLVFNSSYEVDSKRITPRDFIGYSSSTLQISNIAPINPDSTMPNIRENYTVTEKADGLRKLMYIAQNGHIYLIDTNMNVQFTGAITENEKLFQSIIDGEHIIHNKTGQFINLYAAFDIYFINGRNVRGKKFIPDSSDATKTEYRFPILVDIMKHLKPQSVNEKLISPMRFENKKFYQGSEKQSIFVGCNTILNKAEEGGFEYNTDGLIFTPSFLGIGQSKDAEVGPMHKFSWNASLKWKPPEYNTIDFLVSIKKNTSDQDVVSNIFQEGIDAGSTRQLSQYKTLILMCGFDERKHGFLNPCQDIIDDNMPSSSETANADSYKPMPFYPTAPYDTNASIANIMVQRDGTDNLQLLTEEGDTFTDNMIVEFKYDPKKPEFWRWTPLRVRNDKTDELRRGFKNYGNAYHVANSNWHSIHTPITAEMLKTSLNIPDELADDDVYYNSQGTRESSATKALRDFHNYVKKSLILSPSKYGDSLIDFAVGKGGDLPKWIQAKLSFIFGLDISKDNIENRLDGACARYLNFRRKFKVMPHALFIQANSSVNLKSGMAPFSEKGKQITQAVFGQGPKDKSILGEGVYRQYGKGAEGFNISSCQFATHYFFENQTTLNNFLSNISQCTAMNGYFIGTCYDGKKIFNMLRDKQVGESLVLMQKERKIWEITKEYRQTTFEDNVSSIGYPINVFQESINKTFREWLVNFEYFKRLMENYGFILAPAEDLKDINLTQPTGLFTDIYEKLAVAAKTNSKLRMEIGKALDMTTAEKTISFSNRYFIFKKVRNVDTQQIVIAALDETPTEQIKLAEEAKEISGVIKATNESIAESKQPVTNVNVDTSGQELTQGVTTSQVKGKRRGRPKKMLDINQAAAVAALKLNQ